MKEFLKEMLKKQVLVSLYFDHNDSENFSVGVLKAIRDHEILLQCISPEGKYDGYMWVRQKSIYRCEADGKYERKLEKLRKDKQKKQIEGIGTEIVSSKNILQGLLNYAMEQKKRIEILVRSEYFVGQLLDFSSESIVVREVDFYGCDDGKNCFAMDAIDQVHVDTITCNLAERLRK